MYSKYYLQYKWDKSINMEKETLKTKPPVHEDFKALYTSFPVFDLPSLVKKLKNGNSRKKGELKTIILLNKPDKQIVLTALNEGARIKSYQSNDSITFQIIDGKIEVHTKKKSVTLDKGQLLTLPENIKYRLTSMEETVLLLTIANSTLQQAEN
jgi:quercetin dioxygenase-like cupin family protein